MTAASAGNTDHCRRVAAPRRWRASPPRAPTQRCAAAVARSPPGTSSTGLPAAMAAIACASHAAGPVVLVAESDREPARVRPPGVPFARSARSARAPRLRPSRTGTSRSRGRDGLAGLSPERRKHRARDRSASGAARPQHAVCRHGDIERVASRFVGDRTGYRAGAARSEARAPARAGRAGRPPSARCPTCPRRRRAARPPPRRRCCGSRRCSRRGPARRRSRSWSRGGCGCRSVRP